MIRSVLPLCLLPCVAVADLQDYHGTWCQQDGPQAIHVDAYGIGFNEHTVCEWKSGPFVATGGFTGVLNCHNVYVTGQDENGVLQTVEMDHRRGLDISGAISRVDAYGGRIMEVVMSDWAAPLEYGPCG